MSKEIVVTVGIFAIGAIVLIGFFVTKSKGFGKFSASTLVLLTALILSTALSASGIMDSRLLVNVIMAVVGFAGGLIVAPAIDKSE